MYENVLKDNPNNLMEGKMLYMNLDNNNDKKIELDKNIDNVSYKEQCVEKDNCEEKFSYTSIRNELNSLVDEKYKKFHSSLCPNNNNILGVRIPKLRKIAKDISKGDWRKFLEENKNEYYEETMLEGFVIGYAKMELEERFRLLTTFVPKIDNWAVCDCSCSTFKFVQKNKKEMWEFIKTYLNSSKEFELRFAIIIILDYYLTDEYIDEVFKIFDNVKKEDYYVKMAIAWTLQVAYVKYKEKTIKYLENNKLDDFTYNKAIQKMIESYRISKEEKDFLRKMKR